MLGHFLPTEAEKEVGDQTDRARGQILISAQRTVLSVSEGETEVKACPPERGRVCAEG